MAVQNIDGSWTFSVTVSHADKGWDDYADGWDVVTSNGTVLKPDITVRNMPVYSFAPSCR